MRKINKHREVELETCINLEDAPSSFWGDIDYWLKENGFTRKDVKGKVSLDLGTKTYAYDTNEYPILCATFQTLETDKEFKKRVEEEKKWKDTQNARGQKEYERLKKKFEK